MRGEYPFLCSDKDRHGNRRYYVRREGHKVRVRAVMGTPEFAAAYTAALDAVAHPVAAKRGAAPAQRDTLGWLATQYFTSRRFLALDAKSRTTRRNVIEECLREPPRPGASSSMRDFPLPRLSAAVVMMFMERKAGKPGAANNRKKYLSAMFGWAVGVRLLKSNPARDAERIGYATSGFHTWSVDEVRQFEAHHPIGTKARLALALLLFTGARRGDMVTFGRQHVRDGVLRYVPGKTKYKRMTASEKPILLELAAVINASPCGDLTFLVTDYGRPFTSAGFGNWFRDRCNEASLPHCSAHGLRKAGATLAAEAGATDRQLMAMFDWSSASQATVYTAAASRKRLASEGAKLMVGRFGESVPLSGDCPTIKKV